MPRNASGVYSLPASNPVIPFTVITSTWANDTMADVAEALTQSISADGSTPIAADIGMDGFKFLGVGPATLYNQYARADQVQQQEFNVITNTTYDSGLSTYSGEIPLDSGGTTPLVHGQQVVLTPTETNGSDTKLALNGGTAYLVRNPDGTGIHAEKFVANVPVVLVWSGFYNSWVLVGSTGASLISLGTTDAEVVDVEETSPGAMLVVPKTNVANGGVKLTLATKIPVVLMPIDALTLIGLWSADDGNLPPPGTVQGQYYIITEAGTLDLYVASDVMPDYELVFTDVEPGDVILWIDIHAEGQNEGWYYIPRGVVEAASGITSVPTPYAPLATNVQAWMDAIDSAAGFLPTDGGRRATKVFTDFVDATYHSGNLIYDGVNWKYVATGPQGFLIETATDPTYARIDYVTDAAGVAGGIASTLAEVARWAIDGSYVVPPLGLGLAPRLVSGVTQFHFDVQYAGTVRQVLYSTDTFVSTRLSAASNGSFLEAINTEADGTVKATAGIPLVLRLQDAAGNIFVGLKIDNTRVVQVGDTSSGTNPGSICSTLVSKGSYTGALDFTQYQSVKLSPGSTISAVTLASGQVGRILVNGAGSITLPGTLKLPRGGAVYGTAFTVIGVWYDGTNVFTSFTPYD